MSEIQRRDSEVEAYIFIRDTLDELGWNPKNPARSPDGQVYTQNQALENLALQEALDKDRPENIVKISESKYWVIEAKNRREKMEAAIREGIGNYAEPINEGGKVEAVFVSAVAGNDADTYDVKNFYLVDGKFKEITINGEPPSALLAPDIVDRILDQDSPTLDQFPIDEKYFTDKAEEINQILHDGSINKSRRAKVMSALLLSLLEGQGPDIDTTDTIHLIDDINSRVEAALRREGKPDFAEQIKLTPPASEDNYEKFRVAVVRTIRVLKDLNIKSAMNSSADVLGEFYEVFLKYGNGAKEIGIVLTPRHITEFVAEVQDITHNDIVYDPACGTGGFLVAAFDQVRRTSNEEQIDKFKENKLFGIDQAPAVLALAVVNMIFRGDGKNNLQEYNCFHRHLAKSTIHGVESAKYVKDSENHDPPVTKVLMNPPFSLNNPDEKAHRFVEQALGEMEDGGILFSVLPYSTMVKQNQYKRFRDRLLDDHTLLTVIKFPPDLFYPVSEETVGIFVRKGTPHPEDQNVLWVRAMRDGRVKSKGKRLPKEGEQNDFETVEPLVRGFLKSPEIDVETKPKFQAAMPVDMSDPKLDLVPEEYLPESAPTTEEMKQRIHRFLEELLGNLMLYIDDFDSDVFGQDFGGRSVSTTIKEPAGFRVFAMSDLFDIHSGDHHVATSLPEGNIPLISGGDERNGITKPESEPIYCDVPDEEIYKDELTVSHKGQPLTTKFHPYEFATKDDVGVLTPEEPMQTRTFLYIANVIERDRWRYSYGRNCYQDRLRRLSIELPVDEDGELAEEYMTAIVESSTYWPILTGYMES
jgi:type I restriction-modification system DNA methylase subunit